MRVAVAQLRVEKEIAANISKVIAALEQSTAGAFVLFPEGMISGYYPEDESFLKALDWPQVQNAIATIQKVASNKKICVLIGTAYKDQGIWYNATLLFQGKTMEVYKKNNLGTLDRHHFEQGSELRTYQCEEGTFAIQMCRELAFPEQWRLLRSKGAQVVFHINNAVQPSDKVREQVLVARAFENQCWVCSVNNAALSQTMRSLIINPKGETVWASVPKQEEVQSVEINLAEAQDTYLQQARTDLVAVVEQ